RAARRPPRGWGDCRASGRDRSPCPARPRRSRASRLHRHCRQSERRKRLRAVRHPAVGLPRLSSALALAIVAAAITVAFTGVQLACGYRETSAESVVPGETPPPQTSRCVGFLHPMMPPMLLACGLVVAALARGGGRDTAIWVGAALAIVTFSWFSLGWLGT